MSLFTVVRDKVWKDLSSADSIFAEEVRQCISKIENRQFDGGLRVKKLKGVTRIVWEARINQSSRLLFTYRQSNLSNGQSQKFIVVEAICKEHDAVSHQAKIVDRDWWEADEIKVLGDLDRDFDRLSSEDQAEIRLWETEELEIQSELTDELLGSVKWLTLEPEIINSKQEWQNAIESKADLWLRLTPDESTAIYTYGNILLAGGAGTGKTTVGLYRLARTLQMNPTATCLYVGYNPILVQESERQFKQLWGEQFASFEFKVDFLTIRDLCLKITKNLGAEFDRHLVGYRYFRQIYLKRPESKQYPPSLMWDEIRSIIKGANLKEQTASSLLSQKEYENLGKKRSGAIRSGERHKIYKLAQWYQDCLNRDRLADEIDLARAALQAIETARHKYYTLIICDEVQDLTEIQLEVLIRLSFQNGQIFCAGDVNQMISPSGFRWEDLTTRLYQHDRQWTEKKLAVNFRSTGKLGALAIELLNLKSQLLSESQFHQVPSINSTSGELARLVVASENDLKQINLGAGDAILVRTEERKEQLLEILQTQLIFTIEESKGLEFDTVYLVDFFKERNNLWATTVSLGKQLTDRQKPAMRLEFNLLYVAMTRTRRVLNICEPEIADLWKYPEIAQHLISMSIHEAFSQARSIATQDWYQKAIYYRTAKLLPQALECATKSGDNPLKQEIEVDLLLLDRQYDEAAQLLLKIEKYTEAAEIFEQIGAWQQACEVWDLTTNSDRKKDCQHRYAQTYFVRGATKYKAGQIQAAIDDYDRAIVINPQHPEAYVGRGTAKYTLGQNQAAIDDYDRAITLDPQYATAYNNRGLAKYSLGQYPAAINDYDRAIVLNPQYADAYNNRGTAKYSLGQYPAAIDDYDRAITLDPQDAAAHYNRGFAKYSLGQYPAAINDYDRAIVLNSQDVAAYNHRGAAKYALGQYQAAIEDCNRALKIDPQYVDAYNNRGIAKQSLGQHQAALADFERAAELFDRLNSLKRS